MCVDILENKMQIFKLNISIIYEEYWHPKKRCLSHVDSTGRQYGIDLELVGYLTLKLLKRKKVFSLKNIYKKYGEVPFLTLKIIFKV